MSPLLTTPQARKLIAFLAVFGAATLIAFSLFYALSSAPVSAAASIYVSPSGNNTDGSSWTNAYTNVQDALTAATLGDEIWVAAGEYIPTSRRVATDTRSATFELVNGVQMYGGFVGTETARNERDPNTNITVLSGDLDDNDTKDGNGVLGDPFDRNGSNAYHVVAAQGLTANDTRLDGFVITGGYAEEGLSIDGQFDCPSDACAGGIRIYESELILANILFQANEADFIGGAIYNAENSNITILNSQFIANHAFGEAGAIKNTKADALIVNTIFVGNRGNTGGAIRSFSSNLTIINSTFAGNWAAVDGAAIQQTSSSTAILSNTIAYGNVPSENNLVNEDVGSSFTVAYSLISETTPYAGTGNITTTTSPFIEAPTSGSDEVWATADDTFGNLRLTSTSAARDTGSNDLLPLDIFDLDDDALTAETLPVDLDHLNRVNRQVIDMGAYEFAAAELYLIQSGMSTSVAENGATDTYSVVLSIPPQANVTVTIATDPEVSLDKSSLLFTPSNWDTPQPIVVTAVDNQTQEVTKTVNLTHTATTTGSTYSAVPTALQPVEVIDDDIADVTVTESGGTQVFEGGATDSFTLVLDTIPTDPVTVTISSGSDLTTSITETVFDSGNWNIAATVIVTAVNDTEAEGGETASITFSTASDDSFYNGLSITPVSVDIVDNDALVLTPGSLSQIAAEGGTVFTYTLELASAPTDSVTVAIANPDTDQLDISDTSINFGTGDWNVPQVITVTADDDATPELQEILTITNTTSSSDINYNSSVATVDVTVNDDDTPAVNVNQTAATTAVTEGGTVDTIELNLATEPTDTVTVTLSVGSDLMISPTELVFSTGTYSVTQSVTITATDDNSVEGLETPAISFSAVSNDGDYNGISINSLTVSITDDDTATVTSVGISPTITLSLSAITDTYTIVLDSQPTADVVITPTGGDGISTSPASLTFTNANWDQPQTITVTMDQTAENGNTSVSYSVSSSDSNFNNISIPNVTIAIDAKKSYFPIVRIAP